MDRSLLVYLRLILNPRLIDNGLLATRRFLGSLPVLRRLLITSRRLVRPARFIACGRLLANDLVDVLRLVDRRLGGRGLGDRGPVRLGGSVWHRLGFSGLIYPIGLSPGQRRLGGFHLGDRRLRVRHREPVVVREARDRVRVDRREALDAVRRWPRGLRGRLGLTHSDRIGCRPGEVFRGFTRPGGCLWGSFGGLFDVGLIT
ncbi:hypothetical protein SAMN05192558_109132 [Actinokineospora alba]|uniref:Uncharacterized protein n=1 Tax=Actinokineospora alba TaxID=504798 RepID=A0A1H0SWR2_9PSEU|nr:hypothetical protein C8E96_2012 [Actinokineospora alba]SDJ36463.1 hypothetical protein SAMN05421871_11414 [Actinokineospora alba]SDP46000.1 hypothetical protein SAMN05192558_109132 [Actinokineospora alba]